MKYRDRGLLLFLAVVCFLTFSWFLVKPSSEVWADSVSVGSATFTHDTTDRDRNQPFVRSLTVAWTSNASGSVTATINSVRGHITRIVTDPGSAAPTDNYDITLTDSSGIDLLRGRGANRDTANSEMFVPLIGDGGTTTTLISMTPNLTLSITNAGNAKTGSFIIYYTQVM